MLNDVVVQLEEQKFEMERLKRELEEKMAEVTRIKSTLQNSEKVSMHLQRLLIKCSEFSSALC